MLNFYLTYFKLSTHLTGGKSIFCLLCTFLSRRWNLIRFFSSHYRNIDFLDYPFTGSDTSQRKCMCQLLASQWNRQRIYSKKYALENDRDENRILPNSSFINFHFFWQCFFGDEKNGKQMKSEMRTTNYMSAKRPTIFTHNSHSSSSTTYEKSFIFSFSFSFFYA